MAAVSLTSRGKMVGSLALLPSFFNLRPDDEFARLSWPKPNDLQPFDSVLRCERGATRLAERQLGDLRGEEPFRLPQIVWVMASSSSGFGLFYRRVPHFAGSFLRPCLFQAAEALLLLAALWIGRWRSPVL